MPSEMLAALQLANGQISLSPLPPDRCGSGGLLHAVTETRTQRCAFAESLKEILVLLQTDHQSQDGMPVSVKPLLQRRRPIPDNLVLAERGNRWRCRQCGADRAAARRSRRVVVAA